MTWVKRTFMSVATSNLRVFLTLSGEKSFPILHQLVTQFQPLKLPALQLVKHSASGPFSKRET